MATCNGVHPAGLPRHPTGRPSRLLTSAPASRSASTTSMERTFSRTAAMRPDGVSAACRPMEDVGLMKICTRGDQPSHARRVAAMHGPREIGRRIGVQRAALDGDQRTAG